MQLAPRSRITEGHEFPENGDKKRERGGRGKRGLKKVKPRYYFFKDPP